MTENVIITNLIGHKIIFSENKEENEKKRDTKASFIFLYSRLYSSVKMTSRNDLTLEQKINLIKENERGSSYRELKEKFQVSLGSISNILKRKYEYINDYECNHNKKLKRKMKNDINQTINDNVYEWFVMQRSKRIPISGPVLQEYARNVAAELGDTSGFKASNGWLDRFRTRYNIQFRVISGEAAAVDDITIDDWKLRLPVILEHYNPADVYNCDETGLFFKMLPDRSLVVGKADCRGGKRSKERYTVLLCGNWAGTDKLKPLVIGKYLFTSFFILYLFSFSLFQVEQQSQGALKAWI